MRFLALQGRLELPQPMLETGEQSPLQTYPVGDFQDDCELSLPQEERFVAEL
jgi:hypothetical protein